ncbi:DUF1642 domain-containing protein [Streptococcus suis]|uniref:DUF1642 domain-containing protein n=1 Tax=Streptococcus suis TaxID=1307 RepID=UPI0013751DDF|nr:DUF1642 domain-containing protein [Streptococcus suis]
MNKQEAIEQLEWDVVRTTDFDRAEYVVVFEKVKSIISQIHEPQKVVIPKFVAEYIERCKQSGWHLQKVLSRLDDDEKVGDWAYDENDDLISEKVDMVAHAWLFGHEVEQEQLYTVEIPDPNSYCDYRYLSRNENGICLDASNNTKWKQKKRNQFTESEIKQDFEWAWDAGFAKEVGDD